MAAAAAVAATSRIWITREVQKRERSMEMKMTKMRRKFPRMCVWIVNVNGELHTYRTGVRYPTTSGLYVCCANCQLFVRYLSPSLSHSLFYSPDGLCVWKEFLHRTHRRQKRNINSRNNAHLWLRRLLCLRTIRIACTTHRHSGHSSISRVFLFPLLFYLFHCRFYLSHYAFWRLLNAALPFSL